ncbi:MAG: hypothetical protein BGP04_09610 [Rhizobiales bacterium 62-17]|nr:hypothetical protein [Hyphomicrobiales bacterium]OJY05609.1 MAG: hypothetical protein BGP04_09610 [Rhizobiales bacterium 62-17]
MIKKMVMTAACVAVMSLPAFAQAPASGGMPPSDATTPSAQAPADASGTGVHRQKRQQHAKLVKHKKAHAKHSRKPQSSEPDSSDGMSAPQQ